MHLFLQVISTNRHGRSHQSCQPVLVVSRPLTWGVPQPPPPLRCLRRLLSWRTTSRDMCRGAWWRRQIAAARRSRGGEKKGEQSGRWGPSLQSCALAVRVRMRCACEICAFEGFMHCGYEIWQFEDSSAGSRPVVLLDCPHMLHCAQQQRIVSDFPRLSSSTRICLCG